MASNELAIKFTENKYATKLEVSRELKISFIDNIWSNILLYRNNFYSYFPIKSVDNKQLFICFCNSVNLLIESIQKKLNTTITNYHNLSFGNKEKEQFKNSSLMDILRLIAKKHHFNVDDTTLKGIIRGDITSKSKDSSLLTNYSYGINFIYDHYSREINIDFLADLYSSFTGNIELTTFYRSKDIVNNDNRVVIDRVYTSSPAKNIENMMNSLFSFIEKSPMNPLVKAFVALYYMNYIKPFDNHNEEMAILICKAILCHYGLESLGVSLPIESILFDRLQEKDRILYEVMKTSDVTYFVRLALESSLKIIDSVDTSLYQKNIEELKDDFYQTDVEPFIEVKEEEAALEVEEPPFVDTPIKENEKVDVKEASSQVEVIKEEIAISYIPAALDEKQANRLEHHLLESDPLLKKGEAKFYARHCTMGKRYTIANYKKEIKCAYETARTSMDHLADLGYYRKETVKNKYVYTPLKQK